MSETLKPIPSIAPSPFKEGKLEQKLPFFLAKRALARGFRGIRKDLLPATGFLRRPPGHKPTEPLLLPLMCVSASARLNECHQQWLRCSNGGIIQHSAQQSLKRNSDDQVGVFPSS